MKNILILTASIFLIIGNLSAQDKSQIEVEGSSEMKVMPDEATIRVTLSEKAMTTSEVTDGLNKKTKNVTEALNGSGIDDYKLTIDNYYVNIHRVYSKGTARDSGYVANQTVNIVVSDTEKDLVKIVELLHQSADMTFQLQFGLSDKKRKDYEKQLLKLALEDAKNKAALIANVMDIGDYQVHKINYTSQQAFQPVMYMAEARMMKDSDDRTEPTFIPDEQTIGDKVRVIFSFNP